MTALPDPGTWAAELDRQLAGADRPLEIRIAQVGLWWLLDVEGRRMRAAVDDRIERALLRGDISRVRRIVLYDVPGRFVGSFVDRTDVFEDARLHDEASRELRSWHGHLQTWLALTDERREMSYERTPERYEVKTWVLECTDEDNVAVQVRTLPLDRLLLARSDDPALEGFDHMFDHEHPPDAAQSLIWLNREARVLDPSGGVDAAGYLNTVPPIFGPAPR